MGDAMMLFGYLQGVVLLALIVCEMRPLRMANKGRSGVVSVDWSETGMQPKEGMLRKLVKTNLQGECTILSIRWQVFCYDG